MTAPRYQLALIPCTRRKSPVGVTPLTLYRSSGFVTMVKHAQQRCDRILIMSAKYGILGPEDRVAYYDAYLPTLPQEQRSKLALLIAERVEDLELLQINPKAVLSYLPKAYYEFLQEEVPVLKSWAPQIRRPYKNLSNLALIKVLSNEIKGFEEPGLARR